LRLQSEPLKNVNTDNNAVREGNSLQRVQITELTETMFNVSAVRMNDQQQSFRPLVNNTVD